MKSKKLIGYSIIVILVLSILSVFVLASPGGGGKVTTISNKLMKSDKKIINGKGGPIEIIDKKRAPVPKDIIKSKKDNESTSLHITRAEIEKGKVRVDKYAERHAINVILMNNETNKNKSEWNVTIWEPTQAKKIRTTIGIVDNKTIITLYNAPWLVEGMVGVKRYSIILSPTEREENSLIFY